MLAALLPLIGSVVGKIVDRIPDPEARAKAEREAMAAITQGLLDADKSQVEVNKIEAGHRSIFVAGWRPFCGWVAAFGMAYAFIIYPTMVWSSAMWFPDFPPPRLETGELITVLMGMLGMGGLRSWDKKQGLTK